jgi:hypothetical protein
LFNIKTLQCVYIMYLYKPQLFLCLNFFLSTTYNALYNTTYFKLCVKLFIKLLDIFQKETKKSQNVISKMFLHFVNKLFIESSTTPQKLVLGSEWLGPVSLNSLKAELNPICHLLALLKSQHIVYVSRIKVNLRY